MATGNSSTKTIDSWEWDVRVRERNLGKGVIDAKEVERHLAALVDVSEQAETVTSPQPAIGGREE